MNIKKFNRSKRIELIFYIFMLAYPVVQFCIFYLGVNFNSILLAFQKIDVANNKVSWTFDNFKNAIYKPPVYQYLFISMFSAFFLHSLSIPKNTNPTATNAAERIPIHLSTPETPCVSIFTKKYG